MADWLFCPFWHPKSCHKSTKTSQTPQDMYRSGWGLWLHQIWSTWWKIRGQKAKYGYCDLSQNKEFGLLDSLHNFQPLNFIRNLPKPHRLFRTCGRSRGLWLHQIWSTWWKIRGQKAKYGYCDLSQNKEFGLLDSLHNFQPLNFNQKPTKTSQTLQDMWKVR